MGEEAEASMPGPDIPVDPEDAGDIGNPARTTPSTLRGSMSTDSMTTNRKLVLGICAMAKKTSGKPMREILKRLTKYNDFEIKVFNEEMILEAPVQAWPECDALLSWFSTGFPLQKAVDYA